MSLWAITSFFNPANYRRRLINYRIFREALGVPLVAVELSFGGPFELQPDDADVVVQLRGGDVMWQKERLLNIAMQHVPRDCEFVAWLDADIIFDNPNWHAEACEVLSRHSTAQLYRGAYNLAPSYPATRNRQYSEPAGHALAYLVGAEGKSELFLPESFLQIRSTTFRSGMAWGARADLIRKHGFYDACIIGGGDRAWLAAAGGISEQGAQHCRMTPAWRDHYLAWAQRVQHDIAGPPGWVNSDLYHLWHGTLEARRQTQRYDEIQAFQLDPQRDLAIGDSGCWKWNSHKPGLHQLLANYFHGRQEDQAPSPMTGAIAC